MNRRGWQVGGAVLAVACLSALGWLVYTKVLEANQAPPSRGGTPAVAVETAPIERGVIREVRSFAGTLAPRSQFIVAPRIAGRLQRLAVDIGDTVTRDQVVAWLDDAEFVQQVQQAQAELDVAEASLEEARTELEIAERDYQRAESLREQQIASVSELDAARSQYQARQSRLKLAEAQVAQRRAALGGAEVRLSYTQVRASWPENGHEAPRVVGERFADQGAMLSANAPLVSVLDISVLRTVFYVTERDYPRLKIGQRAQVMLDAFPGRTFDATVARLAPVFREASRQARVELVLPDPEGVLKPGMFVRARLELDRADDATLVPTEALVRRGEGHGIFTTEDGETAAFHPVRVGIQEAGLAQILEPEVLRGRVITLGQHLLEDGSAIHVANADDTAVAGDGERASADRPTAE